MEEAEPDQDEDEEVEETEDVEEFDDGPQLFHGSATAAPMRAAKKREARMVLVVPL